eukprot:11172610-Lingulodinium_polyedra.AAC.1
MDSRPSTHASRGQRSSTCMLTLECPLGVCMHERVGGHGDKNDSNIPINIPTIPINKTNRTTTITGRM